MKAHEMLGLIYMLSCRQVESCLSLSVSLFYMTVHGNKILTLKKQGQLDHYRLHNYDFFSKEMTEEATVIGNYHSPIEREAGDALE